MLSTRKLQYWWRGFNDAMFNGELRPLKIKLEMPSEPNWIGEYNTGREIIISPHQSEDDAMATLLHEMIHQWQDENNLNLGHGNTFSKWRKLCRLRTGLLV